MLETFRGTNVQSEIPEITPNIGYARSEMDFRKIIEGMPAWVQVCSLDGTILMVNQAAIQISGYERSEMEGQNWPYPWFVKSESASGYSQGWGTDSWPYTELERWGNIPEFEVTYFTPQNDTRVLGVTLTLLRDESDQPQQVLMVAWDHTQQKAREAELAQAQKIQAVTQLASGIAHDINNNLAVILGYSEFLLSTSESFGDIVRQALAAMRDQSVDCANTVRRLQLFSRTVHKSQFTSFSLNDVVREVVATAKTQRKNQAQKDHIYVKFETDLADLKPIHAYHDGLREALTSLVNNAIDALPIGGIISIKTRSYAGEAVVEIKDNGVGISELDLNRVFDAFYTTKGPASSGLGLSIAYSLITQQGGAISLDSKEGEGTSVAVRLPQRNPDTVEDGAPPKYTQSKVLSVLVVEDEPLVADVFRTFLEAFGHRVVTRLNGAGALESFERQDFDLALVDLGMPEMDGWEVSRRINQQAPDFPIIVATGWNVSLEDAKNQGVQVRAVLRKPFGMQDLARAVNEALG